MPVVTGEERSLLVRLTTTLREIIHLPPPREDIGCDGAVVGWVCDACHATGRGSAMLQHGANCPTHRYASLLSEADAVLRG